MKAYEAYEKGDEKILGQWMDEQMGRFQKLETPQTKQTPKPTSEFDKALGDLGENELPSSSELPNNYIDKAVEPSQIKGENFVMNESSKQNYPDRIKFELSEYLKSNTDINENPITASLNYLYNHHKDDGMFKSRKEVYELIKNVLDDVPDIVRKQDDGTYYFAKSVKQEPSNRQSIMQDIVLEPQVAENYIKHANTKHYSKEMSDKIRADGGSIQSPQLPQGAKTLENPELKNFSSTDDIIPQNQIKGENFIASETSKSHYPENASIEIEEALRNEYIKNDKPVVASIAWLYERHPEMFKSKADVYRTIQAVKENPDLITSGKSADSVMLAKKLNDEKMGDMVISKGDENKIIHANKRRLKQNETLGRDPHTLYTPVKQAGELSDLRSGANAHSSILEASNDIIPHPNENINSKIYAKGGDNLAAGLISGVEEDENGNLSINPAKFITGLGGYTVAKKMLTNPKVQKELKNTIGEQIAKLEARAERGDTLAQTIIGKNFLFTDPHLPNGKYMKGAFSDTATKQVMGEIDDTGAKLILKKDETWTELENILSHDELYKKYPELKHMPTHIKIDKDAKSYGVYTPFEDRGEKYYPITEEINIFARDMDEARSMLLHEIQHAIQAKEKWAGGGNPSEFTQNAFQAYKNLHGEQMARATQHRANMTPDERVKESYTDTLKRVEGEAPEPIIRHKYQDSLAMSEALESRYLDKNGNVIESELIKNAKVLPKPIKDFKAWQKQFSVDKGGKAYIQTPINKLYLSPTKSYNHLTNNTYFKNRKGISGAFVEVFKDPLLIVRQDYHSRPSRQNMADYSHSAKSTKKTTMESQETKSISNSIVFYKPFKTSDGNLHLAGFALDKNGKLLNTTFYAYSHLGKIAKLIKAKKADVLYDKLTKHTKANKLYATHRTNITGLEKMLQSGSMPAPSYAISKNAKTSEKFGDIIIVPKEKHIDPKNDAFVYGGDAWTPRYSDLEGEAYSINKNSKFLKNPDIKEALKKSIDYDDFQIQLQNDYKLDEYINKEAEILRKKGMNDDEAWDKVIQRISDDIYIKQEPTLDNKLKYLQEQVKTNGNEIRGLERGITPDYVHSYKRLNNLDEIKARGDELKSFRNEDKFYEQASKKAQQGYQAPADYMEAKRLDKVALDDVSRIIVPNENYEQVLKMIKDKGLDIKVVKQGKSESANSAIKRSSDNASNYIYAKGGDNLAAGLVSGVEEDENGNLSINPAKFIAGLGGYTVAKKMLTNPKVQKELKNVIGEQLAKLERKRTKDIINHIENSPKKGTNLPVVAPKDLSEDVLNYIKTNRKKITIQRVPEYIKESLAKKFGYKYVNDIRRTINGDDINHALKRHGNADIELSRNQEAITLKDIQEYPNFVNNADIQSLGITKNNAPAIISGKQINGHYVIVEEVQTKQNELAFKTMYKVKGNLADNKIFRQSEASHFRVIRTATTNPLPNDKILPNQSQKVKPADLTGNKLKGEYIKQKLESDTPHTMLYEADDIFTKDGKISLGLDIKDKRILKYLKDNGFKSDGSKISAKATDEAIEIARVAQKMAYKKQVDDVTKKMLEC